MKSDELMEKARGTKPGVRSEIEGPSEGEVRSQLWQMVYEAMGPDNKVNNNDEALNIDPYKLNACLDGHLVLILVEPTPPLLTSLPLVLLIVISSLISDNPLFCWILSSALSFSFPTSAH